MNKKLLLSALCFMLFAFTANAQRYAIIDSKYILEKLTEYKDAQKRLDQFSEQWQQEIDQKQTLVDKMIKEYDAEQVMLSDELKKKREEETYKKNGLVLKATCLKKGRS
jgi:outer membrane protein